MIQDSWVCYYIFVTITTILLLRFSVMWIAHIFADTVYGQMYVDTSIKPIRWPLPRQTVYKKSQKHKMHRMALYVVVLHFSFLYFASSRIIYFSIKGGGLVQCLFLSPGWSCGRGSGLTYEWKVWTNHRIRRAADVRVKVREPLSEDNSLEFYKGQGALNSIINVVAISVWVSSGWMFLEEAAWRIRAWERSVGGAQEAASVHFVVSNAVLHILPTVCS